MTSIFKTKDIWLVIFAAMSYIVQMIIIPKSITIPIVGCVAAVIAIYWYLNEYKNTTTRILPFVKYFGPFYMWVALSVFWTVNANYSFALIRAILTFEFGIFVGLFAKEYDSMKRVLQGFILGGFISTMVVLYNQYMLIGIIRLGEFIYGSAMEFSGGLCFSAYSCIVLYRLNKKKYYLVLFGGCIVLCALSGSRTAIIYPFIFWLIFDFFYNQSFTKIFKILIFIGVAFFVVGFTCIKVPVFYNMVGHRFENLLDDKTEDGSYMERKEMKDFGMQIWKEAPIIGWGCHGFAKKYELINKNVFSHCDYIELLSCFGLIGFLLFYRPYIVILFKRDSLSIAKHNYWQSFFIAFLILNLLQSNATIHFLNLKTMMMLSLICNNTLELKKC